MIFTYYFHFLLIIMELLQLFSSFTSTTWFFLITIFLLSFIKFNSNTSKSKNLPPGPWKLPIIGSMHHMVGNALPYQILSKLAKKYGPVMHLQLGEIPLIVFSSSEVAKLVMKTHDLAFINRPSTLAIDIITYNKSNISFAPYGDYWRQMRKLCVHELLSAKQVKSFQSIRESEVANMIASIQNSKGSPINLTDLFFSFSSAVVSTAMFGENINKQGASIDLSTVNEVGALIGGFNLDDFFPSLKFIASVSGMKTKLEKVHKKIDTMLHEIIKKRRECYAMMEKSGGKGAREKEDMLDTLLRLQKQNEQEVPITDDMIKAVSMDMIIGGSDSSAAVLEWAMSELILNPEKMEKVQSEVKQSVDGNKSIEEGGFRYLSVAIKETLRIHTPGPLLIPRECMEACEIDGYHIPLKAKIIINARAIGRDPNVWEDAEKFIPERFEKNMVEFNGNNCEYLPFGSGRRICLGISFGLSAVELALIQLLYHFNWELPNNAKGESLDMTEAAGLVAKRKIPLQLVARARE